MRLHVGLRRSGSGWPPSSRLLRVARSSGLAGAVVFLRQSFKDPSPGLIKPQSDLLQSWRPREPVRARNQRAKRGALAICSIASFSLGESLNSNLAVLVFFVMDNPQFSLWDTSTVRTKNA